MEKTPSPPFLRTCPACNSRIEPDHEFCEICGAKMPELPACSNCGARFIAPVKFCELCGTPVNPRGAPAAVQEKRPEPAIEPGLPSPVQPAVKREAEVPVPSAPEQPGTDDDVLFFPPGEKVTAKPPANKARVIGGIIILVVILAAIGFIALPFLTGNGGPGLFNRPAAVQITPLPDPPAVARTTPPALTRTPVPTTTTSGAFVPQPTQLLPAGQKVYFQVQKDQVTAKISVIFAGSTVANSVSSADVKVTQPGGAIATGIILPLKGVNELTLSGSRETDRVEIIAKMTSGQTYRVYDQLVPFKR